VEDEKMYDEIISVIIPAYNAASTIARCLDSVLGQTYKHIEIIVVNDGSTDSTQKILDEYCKLHSRIKVLNHQENSGLFAARLTGVKEATGKYIGFVDSDDFISVDYYRLLVKAMIDQDADIVIGNFYLQYPNGEKEYFNLDPIRNQNLCLQEDDVLKTFMSQRGLFYGWQLVWNKLYNTRLWKERYKDLDNFARTNIGLTMTEDIAFSAAIWTIAKKVVNTSNANYIYCQSPNQSTSQNQTSEKYLNNLKQVVSVFDFFRKMLSDTGKFQEYSEDYFEWRKLMGRIYATNFQNVSVDNETLEYLKRNFFKDTEISSQNTHDVFFYSLKTTLDESYNWFEDIKYNIVKEDIKYVSFDVFDTVVYRPFWFPTDIFYLMNNYFVDLVGAKENINFARIRIESEKSCRQKMQFQKPGFEDITLDEIYQEIENRYCLSHDTCKKMQIKEVEFEKKYCLQRKTGKELYDLALYLGKKILFVSDMYLDYETINIILKKNGYIDSDNIFISSEIRLGKYTGHLYSYVAEKLNIKLNQWFHIGDNWETDIENAKKAGLKAGHLAKAIDIFCGYHSGIYAGKFFNKNIEKNSVNHDLNYSIQGYLGFRTMLAVVANKIFDNPYVSFNRTSDFNGEIRYIGYFLLGMYLYSITDWLVEETSAQQINKVQFVARDGYLLQKAFDKFRCGTATLPESNYLYVSRKSMMLANIYQREDLLSLIDNINIFNLSPEKFLALFANVLKRERQEQFLKDISDYGFISSQKFVSRYAYEMFLKLFTEKCWDDLEWKNYRTTLKDFIDENVTPNDVMVDIGYSGRIENCIHTISGHSINSYYIHNNSENVNRRERLGHFKNKTFYGYKPDITGVIREHVFMKCAPSTIGYRKINNSIEPVFEDYNITFDVKFMTELLQSYALNFVQDILDVFGEDRKQLYYRYEDGTQPFEWYLQHGQLFDRSVFSTLEFEDDAGIGKVFNALDFWSEEIARTTVVDNTIKTFTPPEVLHNPEWLVYETYKAKGIATKSLLKKMLYWMVVDPKFMKKRISDYIKGRR